VDLIKEAIRKAKSAAPVEPDPPLPQRHDPAGLGPIMPGVPGWLPTEVALDPARLESNRIVAFAMNDPTHVAFNLLRTRIFKAMQDNRWRTLAITSPSAGCGKTMVAINLAFSLARQPACKTVLIDLDLKKPALAWTLGVDAADSIGRFLQGEGRFEDCFVRVAPNLTVGLNRQAISNSSELLHRRGLLELFQRIKDQLSPEVIVLDLPPMLTTDEAIAVVPHVDSSLLVIAAGKTTAPEVSECERHLSGRPGYFGVVLNKAEAAHGGGYGY
jgi:Mrp family chromosome partitioning ATPase